MCSSSTWAEDHPIRHEITGGITWISDEWAYHDYIVNGEAFPAVSGNLDKDYTVMAGAYAFFFTPIPEDHTTPIALRRFYTHPTTVSLNFFYQPEKKLTYHYQNLGANYHSSTDRDASSRSAGVDVEYYLKPTTGLCFHLSAEKNEEAIQTSDTLDSRGTGDSDEIRRYYGVGVSQYMFDHLNLKLSYTILDFKSSSNEKTWTEDRPLLFTHYFKDTDTTGKKITLVGEYVFRKLLGIQGVYVFWDQKAHSKELSFYADTFLNLDSYYNDTIANHTLGMSVSLYLWEKMTFRVGGSYTRQALDRTYQTDQVIEYDWKITTVEASLLRYLNRHIGVQIGYKFATQDGDVLIRHPASENDPRTTYTADADFHSVYIGVTGRF